MEEIAKRIENTEITLLTKKTKKETKVFVNWFNTTTNILCGWYTNKFGDLTIKQFDMNKYDFCL
jgi:hypothetical protein